MPSLHSIKGIEIFREGKWNDDIYSHTDLQSMIDAFPLVGFQPPVVIGHDRKHGEAAAGWVERIYLKGRSLYADLKDIPADIYDMIKSHALDFVSCEVFFNIERGGRKFNRTLKAIALLGSSTPAVSGLAPLRTVVHGEIQSYRRYTLSLATLEADDDDDQHENEEHTMNAIYDPGGELVTLAQTYLSEHPSLTYSEAMRVIRSTDDGQRLIAEYNAMAAAGPNCRVVTFAAMKPCPACVSKANCRAAKECTLAKKRNDSEYSADADQVVLRRASDLLEDGEVKSFSAAVREVLRSDPALAAEYAACVGSRR